MVRLRTLGALELSDASGTALAAVLSRQRRVALLVYLAVEGRGGLLRRESLFRVFWPELDQARARAALRQSLYVLRSEVGEEVVVSRGAEEVGLSPALECDATTFEEHAAAGRYADARAQYRGPFLNGFFISDAPEFERWVDERRDVFRRRAAVCELQLATARRERGDLAGAAHHMRAALELEPTDEATLRALMRVLDSAGDRGAALREFAQYTESLRRDYEIVPSAETTGLADEIRESGRGAEWGSTIPRVSGASATVRADPPRPSRMRRTIATWRTVALAGAAVVAVAAGTVALLRSAMVRDVASRDEPRLLVLPFTVRGGAEFTYLGEGMSDLLSTSLDGPDLFRAVPPALVLRDTRELGAEAAQPDAARAAARRLRASHFVLGSVVAAQGRVRFEARLYRSDSVAAAASATVEGSPDSIFTLVDRLAAQLIAAARGRAPAERLRGSAAMTTTSLAALREYLSGERAYRDGAFGPAIEFFRRAVAADSTFALAYYRMSMAAEWQGERQEAIVTAAVANRHANRLSDRDGALLRAHYTMVRGASDDAEGQYRSILRAYPDDAEAWLKVGEILFHSNPRRGRPQVEARMPFLRVLSYEPRHRAALLHLVRIAAFQRDQSELDSLSARYLALGVVDRSLGVRLLEAIARRDTAQVAALSHAATRETDEAIADAATNAMMYGRSATAALAMLSANLVATRGTQRRLLTHIQMAAVELTRGRPSAARRHFQRAAEIDHAAAVHQLEAFYACYAAPFTPDAELRRLRDAILSDRSASGVGPRAGVVAAELLPDLIGAAPAFRALLLSELSLRLGDTSAAKRYARDLSRLRVEPGVATLYDQLVQLGRARTGTTQRQADSVNIELMAIRQPSGDFAINWTLPWHAAQRHAVAQTLIPGNRRQDALALLTSAEFQGLYNYPFAPIGFLRAAQLREVSGDSVGAARDYARVVEFWSDADPEYRESVRLALQRVQSRP